MKHNLFTSELIVLTAAPFLIIIAAIIFSSITGLTHLAGIYSIALILMAAAVGTYKFILPLDEIENKKVAYLIASSTWIFVGAILLITLIFYKAGTYIKK
ncbi:MAG: hypothetical protein NTU61_00340 [Candidatus Altiarchaeota archaeon]|nr:hypothetical protein [Candidatus Altiarchaeota archaeon]